VRDHPMNAHPIALLALAAALQMHPSPVVAQNIRLSVEAPKAEFFEGEPVYLLVRAFNAGSDTAWLMPPDLGQRTLVLVVTRPDGSRVPELAVWMDYAYPPGWKGVALAPGGTRFEVAVLQDFFGDDGPDVTPIYNRHLRTGQLQVVAKYNPALPDQGDAAQAIVTSSPLQISIRPRRPNEEAAFRDVTAVRALAWRPSTRGQYAAALLELIARRQAADSTDPFVPFLVNEGTATLPAIGIKLDPRSLERLYAMRLGAARAFRATPAGAIAAMTALSMKPDQAPVIQSLLGTSLSSEIIRERQTRARKTTSN